MIRTFNLDAETTDFDNLVTQLQQETQNLGGYVEVLMSMATAIIQRTVDMLL